ncbi:polar amino acid transport system substrate-binding protein [Pseudoduganella namucuonensis]|uniref:Polar amino acid transport system substrate-binding protein n=2 Tax=Pseudoduganella namucuonensis TaxID=1035707 RepID=A0A1I7LMD0_9BURK|nr:polar amino acid transport system substrate-binding protein [Pseudoduganella namucuonensis]
MKLLRLLGLCAGLLLTAPAPGSGAPVMRFATEEWPPFFSSALPDNGLTGALLGAVLERMGHMAQIDYFPWKRAMEFGLHDRRYAGVVAMFRTPEREQLCHFSSAIGSRQTVLAFLRDEPVSAATLADLRGVRVGTVAGYSNGEQFDGLVRAGVLKVEEGVSDEINLRKLLGRRFSAIVVEKHMLRYLMAGGRYTKAERERVVIAEHLFRERPVHVCFQRTEEGLRRQQAFSEAAREVDLARIERDYWRGIGEAAPARQ